MKQTSIEWLIEKLDNNLDINHSWRTRQYIEQAKEMEKQQIIAARAQPLLLMNSLREKHGYFGGYDNGQVIQRELDKGIEYYNKTFKSE